MAEGTSRGCIGRRLGENQRAPHILNTPHSCCALKTMAFKQIFKKWR